MYKVQHNVRPSEAKKIHKEEERTFLQKKNVFEKSLSDTILQLSMWNSYFGISEEEEDGKQGAPLSAPVAAPAPVEDNTLAPPIASPASSAATSKKSIGKEKKKR